MHGIQARLKAERRWDKDRIKKYREERIKVSKEQMKINRARLGYVPQSLVEDIYRTNRRNKEVCRGKLNEIIVEMNKMVVDCARELVNENLKTIREERTMEDVPLKRLGKGCHWTKM